MIKLKTGHRLFWILQTSGWLLYMAFSLLVYRQWGNLTWLMTVQCVADSAIGFLATLGLRSLYRKINIREGSVVLLCFRGLALSVLAACLATGVSILLQSVGLEPMNPPADAVLRHYAATLVAWIAPFIGWSTLYFGIKFWQEWTIQKEKAEEARELAQTAQLQMLRYRINPHFLFNTLNSIRALISENKTSAKAMITELSEYLRYSLVSRNHESVPFRDEMESVRHYLAIEKMRYENKLEVSLDVDPEAEEFSVPSFLLHPIVENAIGYGMSTSLLPLKIRIGACLEDGVLRIRIVNSGSWVESTFIEKDEAVVRGLDNVRQRLAEACPAKHHLEISSQEGSVSVLLAIGERGGR